MSWVRDRPTWIITPIVLPPPDPEILLIILIKFYQGFIILYHVFNNDFIRNYSIKTSVSYCWPVHYLFTFYSPRTWDSHAPRGWQTTARELQP